MKRDQNTNGSVEPLAELQQEISVVVVVVVVIMFTETIRDPAGPEPADLRVRSPSGRFGSLPVCITIYSEA